jgi:uncharacterized protein YdhG (YjbR/CyaY superfamily)
MTRSQEVDAYIAALPMDRQGPMKKLREILTATAPDADEVIAYKMPALRLKDRFFMSYDAFKDHYSLFPSTGTMSAQLGDEIAPHVKGKGTLQFKADEPLPEALIRRVVEIRLEEFR